MDLIKTVVTCKRNVRNKNKNRNTEINKKPAQGPIVNLDKPFNSEDKNNNADKNNVDNISVDNKKENKNIELQNNKKK